MTETQIPTQLAELTKVRDVGCTGVTLRAISILEMFTDQTELITQCMRFLRRELNGYASLWHLERALASGRVTDELPLFAARLRSEVQAAVETAADLLAERSGSFVTAPSSGITKRVLARLSRTSTSIGEASTALCGADAIGPDEILNIVGTRDLAHRLPTVIVTTSDRLVPPGVFADLGSPLFERIPLSSFEAIVVGRDVLTPAEAGARASALSRATPAPYPA